MNKEIKNVLVIIFFCYLAISLLNGVRMTWIERRWICEDFNNAESTTFSEWITNSGTD